MLGSSGKRKLGSPDDTQIVTWIRNDKIHFYSIVKKRCGIKRLRSNV